MPSCCAKLQTMLVCGAGYGVGGAGAKAAWLKEHGGAAWPTG